MVCAWTYSGKDRNMDRIAGFYKLREYRKYRSKFSSNSNFNFFKKNIKTEQNYDKSIDIFDKTERNRPKPMSGAILCSAPPAAGLSLCCCTAHCLSVAERVRRGRVMLGHRASDRLDRGPCQKIDSCGMLWIWEEEMRYRQEFDSGLQEGGGLFS
jgi:hypothetical protein